MPQGFNNNPKGYQNQKSNRIARVNWLAENIEKYDLRSFPGRGNTAEYQTRADNLVRAMKNADVIAKTTYPGDVNLPNLIADAIKLIDQKNK